MIKTITYAGKTYEVQDDNRLSEEYILVGLDQRILTLDALKAFGVPIEYDVVAREKLPYGLYSYGGNLEHAEIYRYNRSGWWNGNLPAGEDDFIAIEAALAENLLYKLRIDENGPLC